MGLPKNLAGRIGSQLAPKIADAAPGLTTSFVQEALHRAINGVGPLPGAAEAADKQLKEQNGDREKAVRELIQNHATFAGGQGFLANVGGLATAAVAIPANITGLALIQCRMIAGIAHLRGYDLEDPRVRNAVLICLLGEEKINLLVKNRRIPAPPMAVATAPARDPELDKIVAAEVASELVTKVAGTRMAIVAGRRVPVLGGAVGAGVDGWSTIRIGRYAARELLPRAIR